LIEIAQGEVQRLAEISKNMLSLHRESRAPSVVDLPELLESVVSLIEETIAKGRRNIHLQPPGFDCEVEGFPSELRQVFTNVIKNAEKRPPNAERLEFSVNRQRKPTAVACWCMSWITASSFRMTCNRNCLIHSLAPSRKVEPALGCG
jgi:two-component system, NtrC family, sensor kinase